MSVRYFVCNTTTTMAEAQGEIVNIVRADNEVVVYLVNNWNVGG